MKGLKRSRDVVDDEDAILGADEDAAMFEPEPEAEKRLRVEA